MNNISFSNARYGTIVSSSNVCNGGIVSNVSNGVSNINIVSKYCRYCYIFVKSVSNVSVVCHKFMIFLKNIVLLV